MTARTKLMRSTKPSATRLKLRAIGFKALLFAAAIANTCFVPETLPCQTFTAPQNAQNLEGDPVIARSDDQHINWAATGGSLYFSNIKGIWSRVYKAPPGVDIVAIQKKTIAGIAVESLVLLSNGQVVLYDESLHKATPVITGDFSFLLSAWKEVGGDAIYGLSFTYFAVARDTETTWKSDTAGLSSVNFNAFALDTAQYVYLATTGGLYKQAPDSNVWHKLTTFPSSYANAIYVDPLNRIYAGTYSSSYLSTDGGSSWVANATGLLSGGITRYGHDVFHNIYAVGGGAAYRSDSGTHAWVRIDSSITRKIADPVSQFTNPYNDIGGDTVVFLATSYGMFASTDQGRTWSESNIGIQASAVYGYLKAPGRQFASTNLGLFYLNNGDSAWTKSFPSNGYAVGNAIYSDNGGILYTLGSIINSNNSQSPNSNWKSTDNGTTWLPDTAGISPMKAGSIPKYFADESGIQHYAVSGIPVESYQKSGGSAWTPDTAGWWRLPGNFPNVIASDQHGSVYAALTTTTDYTGLLLKRPLAGGTWVFDTAGLQKAIVYSISADQSGHVYAGTFGNGVYKRTGSTWASLSSPPGLNGNDAFVTAVNKSGALFAGFAFQNGFNYAWQGVYFTTTDGGSWTKVGLDGIAVRALIPYGDSVYAVTYNDGLYILTTTAVTGVSRQSSMTPHSYALFQNYPNPFNPTTKIGYQLSAISKVSLKVYDLLGRVVATLVNGEMRAGTHEATFDASRFASGV